MLHTPLHVHLCAFSCSFNDNTLEKKSNFCSATSFFRKYNFLIMLTLGRFFWFLLSCFLISIPVTNFSSQNLHLNVPSKPNSWAKERLWFSFCTFSNTSLFFSSRNWSLSTSTAFYLRIFSNASSFSSFWISSSFMSRTSFSISFPNSHWLESLTLRFSSSSSWTPCCIFNFCPSTSSFRTWTAKLSQFDFNSLISSVYTSSRPSAISFLFLTQFLRCLN